MSKYKFIPTLLIFTLLWQNLLWAGLTEGHPRGVCGIALRPRAVRERKFAVKTKFKDFGELLQPYFASPSTGRVIDATARFPQVYLHCYPGPSTTCDVDRDAKFKRDCNINWVVSTPSRRDTLLILCAGSTDYHAISDIKGIERIILADIDDKALVRAWQNMPERIRSITYLLRADLSWLDPEAIKKIIRAIKSSTSPDEAKEKVMQLLEKDESIWRLNHSYRFPDGYGDVVIMEKSYPQISLLLRSFIIDTIEKHFSLHSNEILQDDSEFYDRVYDVIARRLHPIIADEIARITNPEGGTIYISAEEYQHSGQFDPPRKIIDENDPIYSVRNTSNISRFLPVETWRDIVSRFYYSAFVWRGLYYLKGGKRYPLARCNRLGSEDKAIINGLANSRIAFGKVKKIDEWGYDYKLITATGETVGMSLDGYLRERSAQEHVWHYSGFLAIVLRVCINLCSALEILHKNGIACSLDEEHIFFPKGEKLPILVIDEDSLRFDTKDRAERREALFWTISKIGHLIRASFRYYPSPSGFSDYERATGDGTFALTKEQAEALDALICDAVMHSHSSYRSFSDFKKAVVRFGKSYLYAFEEDPVKQNPPSKWDLGLAEESI